jgi:type II secretory pathway component GspD/PulD (secretin)
MKTENVFAVMVAMLAPCLATLGQNPSPPPALIPPLVSPEAAGTNIAVADEVVELVAFDTVPLPDAIRTLALQAGLNIQFDPKLVNGVGADGKPISPPTVTEKWHKVTAMQALQALLDNYSWQLQWDPRTKIGRVTAKDLAAKEPLVVAVVALRYGNPTNIIKEISGTLSTGSEITPDMRTHQLIIRTTEKELPGVEALITKLDTVTRQVLVEAKLIETSKDITSAKGVDWTGTLSAQHVNFGNGLTGGSQQTIIQNGVNNGSGSSTTLPSGNNVSGTGTGIMNTTSNLANLTTTIMSSPASGGGLSVNTAHGFSPATAFLNADGVQAVLSFLNTDSDTKTIAFPRTVSLDGEKTELMVVNDVPIFQQTQSAPANGSAVGLATIQPNYNLEVNGTILNEVGIKLTVTPRIAGPTNVLLDVRPEISAQAGVVSETLNGEVNQAPSFSRSRIMTQASVPSGYTLVLGGLDQDVLSKNFTKVPFLGDLPGIGYAFRSDSKSHSKQTILIFVTPTIIRDTDYQPANDAFLKLKPEAPSGIKEAPWDTGEPYDWTKPKPEVAPEYQP